VNGYRGMIPGMAIGRTISEVRPRFDPSYSVFSRIGLRLLKNTDPTESGRSEAEICQWSNWGWESHQIQTDQFGFGAVNSVPRSRDRDSNTESDSTGKMSDFSLPESEPTGTDDFGSRSKM